MPASRKLKTAKVVGGTSSGRFLVLYQGCVRLTLTTSYRTARRYAPADRGRSTSVCGRIRSPPGLSAARLAGLGAGGTDRRTNGPIAASLNAPPHGGGMIIMIEASRGLSSAFYRQIRDFTRM